MMGFALLSPSYEVSLLLRGGGNLRVRVLRPAREGGGHLHLLR
jgi:hypothetical protein